ncbi:TetR/AcrR family transcriptional regulator [Hyphomonas sp.]|uniref:TetR/AcrR family transcriptional regulator n=1 Tax=Hyphomonas sp. TaxID=87 RepID=UPI000C5757C6|nr:TetR/AcrR family transcriptional regulator [Hyphomonas sp.]MAU68575.1 TetR family transcriptional regulator [Hyphomonas sp.]MBM59820.1 TetR family transcriptional regulator [Hyphomonas sp.]
MAETSPSPRRGRPRSFDPHEVMQQVQDAFWKGGFEGPSIGDLAGATGLNRPSLYGAFGDKHALYIQALQQYRDATQAAGRKILEDAPTLRTALEDLFRAAIRLYTDDEEARGCFVASTAPPEAMRDTTVRRELAVTNDGLDEMFEARIARAQAEGEACTGLPPDEAARIASAVLHSLSVRARAGASRRALHALAQSAVDLLAQAPETGRSEGR